MKCLLSYPLFYYAAEIRVNYRFDFVRFMIGTGSTALAFFLSGTVAKIFVGYDAELYELTVRAFKIFSCSFLLAGFNIFASAFFTALNNGTVSALISFLRTLLFQSICVLVLPIVFGINGIWWAMTVAEIFALIVSVGFIIGKRKKKSLYVIAAQLLCLHKFRSVLGVLFLFTERALSERFYLFAVLHGSRI